MSNFPYNHHKYSQADTTNGSPLNLSQAKDLAYQLRMWHGTVDTDDWSESNDGAEHDVICLAFGLMELLSDPSAIRRLIMTGETVIDSCNTMLNSKINDIPFFVNGRKVLVELTSKATE